MKQIILSSLIGMSLNLNLLLSTVSAKTVTLGVVKSPDNAEYWSGITTRLRATGIDYCIVEWSQVQQASDFGTTRLLFLPNIERLEPIQLAALQDWMRQGGEVIVSGAAGTLSQPAIRNRLRSLLGAYWGFALTEPTTLETTPTNSQTWVQGTGLVSTIEGGVVIPANLNSTTAAVWNQQENPPAVVTTDQSIFLGWRWGVDEVSSVEVDTAWLKAALNYYNLTPKLPDSSISYCGKPPSSFSNTPVESDRASEFNNNSQPQPTINNQQPITNPDVPILPAQTQPQDWAKLTPTEVSAMNRELENLIGRFESTLLAANATNTDVPLLTSTTAKSTLNQPATNNQQPTTNNQQQILTQAKIGLQNFLNAAAQQDYTLARQHWVQARRILWDNYPIDRKLAQPEIRAIWLDRGTIVKAKSEQDLAKIFDQLATAGFNTVFFETVNASYPIYPSQVAPEQNPLVRGWDPLKAAVKLAHERGIELHAWVWIFAAANQRHNALLNQPLDYPGPVLAAHPDWAIFDNQGRLFDPTSKKAFLDPANPQVRNYLTALLEEIANNYEVDGIQLDYIRYPFQEPKVNQTYGYGISARQQFKELTGIDPIDVYPKDIELWQKWTDFRIRQIDSFVASVSARLKAQHPNLILSTAVFAIPRSDRLQRLQQNWENWASEGYIDLLVPMTYALDTEGLQNLAQPLLTESTLNSALILPGIRLLNLPDIIAIDQIQLLRDLPASGYALFAMENLNTNLQDILNRTQGREGDGERGRWTREPTTHPLHPLPNPLPNPLPEPVPYRQPFNAAATRFETLQREWSYLWANNQITIHQDSFVEWSQQTDALAIALNQLATDPSTTHLLSAKATLSSFRSQFHQWMQQQTLRQPYQVQVWHYRLATIEQFLNYGERTMLRQYAETNK